MIKACIFDLDGTIVDTLVDLSRAINFALKEKGYDISYSLEETKSLIGQGTKVLCKRALKPFNVTVEDELDLFKEFSNQYNIHQLDNAKLFKGVKETLTKIKLDGIKIAILSNKVDKNSKKIIYSLVGEDFFDIVQGQLENVPLKPDPTSLLNLIDRLGVKKEEILYVGDSDTDMKVGKNANVKTIAVTYGYREKELLKSFEPDFMIDKIEDLIKIIKKYK